jgi:hypothetical protein
MPYVRCVHCSAPTRTGVHFCTACGRRLSQPLAVDTLAARFHTRELARRERTPRCSWCRQPVRPRARFCPGCGAPLPAAA